MSGTENFQKSPQHDGAGGSPPLQHQWSQLGHGLHALEDSLRAKPGNNQQQMSQEVSREKRTDLHRALIAQLYQEEGAYSRDTRYLAFLLIKAGRGGAIVGNPFVIEKSGTRRELPYTGLEGYYAGSEQTPTRGGMTAQEIIQEEAHIGAETLGNMKKHAVAQNSWASYSQLKRALEEGNPNLPELRTCRILWSTIVRQLHVRVFHNAEFELTLSERIEQLERLAGSLPGRSAEEKQARLEASAERDRLKRELARLSEAEREQERRERRTLEKIRADRLAEFQHFRDETYQMLEEPGQERYLISIQDASPKGTSILETISLPGTPERGTYPPTPVQLTREQLEGYLFLDRLGQIGGDPLARSDLVSSF